MSALEEVMATIKEASAGLDRTMSTMHSEAEEDRQKFTRIRNSVTQSSKKMNVHFKKTRDILKGEKCQG